MSIYFVGDIQGCFDELQQLLKQVEFNKKKDQLWVAGDLVARGPKSLETIIFLMSLKDSAKIVLGNHDLHLLATYEGIKKVKPKDNLDPILNSSNVIKIMNWLAKQPLIQKLPNENVYMTHAGLSPQWSIKTAVKQAHSVHKKLTSKNRRKWLSLMYGEHPNYWDDELSDIEKFRYSINALTRMRFCYKDGILEFDCKNTPMSAPKHIKPWFELTKQLTTAKWIFGHWASLEGVCSHPNVYALDTGCVWGNHLTLLRWDDKRVFIQKALYQ